MISHLNFSLYSLEYIFLEIHVFLNCWLNDSYQYALLLRGWSCIPEKINFLQEKKTFAAWHISVMLPKLWDIKGIAPQLNESSLSKLRKMHANSCRLILWKWDNLHLVSFHLISINLFKNSNFSGDFFPASPLLPQRIPVKIKEVSHENTSLSNRIYSSKLSCLSLTWQQ